MIFGKDDSSSSSDDEETNNEDIFGKEGQTGGAGKGMMMMPQGKFDLVLFNLFSFSQPSRKDV